MRISDWSSDVCSSDLIDGQVVIAHRRALGHAPIGFAGAVGVDRQRQLELRVRSAMRQPQRALERRCHGEARRHQIGRASWRERVWQYVSISVVADSLKKNKIQT